MNIEEKYAPQCFADLIFADTTVESICHRYATSKPHKPLMLWGPPGTAKTTTARIIVKERHSSTEYESGFGEFNGADLSSSDFDKLLNTASALKLATRDPILIINEFDELPVEDQSKFRAWMDRWKWINLVVTTNEKPGIKGVRQKLIPALISRFECVELAPPSLSDVLPRARSIFQQEGHAVSDNDLQQLLSTYSGDIRCVLPLIEAALQGLSKNVTQPAPSKPKLQLVSTPPPTQ